MYLVKVNMLLHSKTCVLGQVEQETQIPDTVSNIKLMLLILEEEDYI